MRIIEMNIKTLTLATAALLLTANPAWTADEADEDSAESTIRLMGAAEVELPEAVTKEIMLPKSLREDSKAVKKAANRLETANKNRERRESGLSNADEARERGANMADDAKENLENRGRSDEHRPEEPPSNPGRPEN
jgi:hypothetical protein